MRGSRNLSFDFFDIFSVSSRLFFQARHPSELRDLLVGFVALLRESETLAASISIERKNCLFGGGGQSLHSLGGRGQSFDLVSKVQFSHPQSVHPREDSIRRTTQRNRRTVEDGRTRFDSYPQKRGERAVKNIRIHITVAATDGKRETKDGVSYESTYQLG